MTAEGGGALKGVAVCAEAVGATGEEGYGCERTEADGTYEIAGLPAGEYIVEFWPGEANYVTQFWNDEPSLGTADLVSVTEGTITPAVDAELEPGATISGTVTAAATGLPVAGVEVCASTTETERCSALTNAAGRYTIPGLSAGSWGVYFYTYEAGQNLLSQPYAGGPVALNPKEARGGINAALQVGGNISGTVRLAATGASLPGVVVCLTEATSTTPLACLKTPKSGGYRFTGIWTGSFKVAFSPEMSELYEPQLAKFVEEEEGYVPDSYPTQWWNGQSTFAAATPIGVTAPATVTGIDGALGPPAAAPATSAAATTPAPVVKKAVLECHRGFVKRKVKGKLRCVKRHKATRHKAKGREHVARHRRHRKRSAY